MAARGKKAKSAVKNTAKDAKYVKLFNHFRRNVESFTDRSNVGQYRMLKAVNTNCNLFDWMCTTPFLIQQNTYCAFVRSLRKNLYQKHYLNHGTGKFKFKDLKTYSLTASDAASVYPKASGLDSNFTTFHQSLNRFNNTCRDEWRLAHVGATRYPAEWDQNWKKISINHDDFFCLKKEEEAILERCETVRGGTERKASSMSVKTFMALLAFVMCLQPSAWPHQRGSADAWNGTDLLSCILVNTMCLQPGRSEEEFIKRSWSRDVTFGRDLGGAYVLFREAANTKVLKTKKANEGRVQEKIYKRTDGKGLYSLLQQYHEVRPNVSDIEDGVSWIGNKRNKSSDIKEDNVTLADGYFLQIRGMYRTRNDGTRLLFQNMNMGSTNVRNLWMDLLKRAGITEPFSLYSTRATAATCMMKISKFDLNQISEKTGHDSSCVSLYVQKDLAKDANEQRDTEINTHQDNVFQWIQANKQNRNSNSNANPPSFRAPTMLLPLPPLNTLISPNTAQRHHAQMLNQKLYYPIVQNQNQQSNHNRARNASNTSNQNAFSNQGYHGSHIGYNQTQSHRHKYY